MIMLLFRCRLDYTPKRDNQEIPPECLRGFVSCLSLERYHAQRRNGDGEHVIAAVAGHRHGGDAAEVTLAAAAVQWCIAVEHFLPEAALRHANLIIVARKGCEITDDGERFVGRAAFAQ